MSPTGRPAAGPAEWHAAFRLLFETSATPAAILDEQRRLLDLNDAAQRMLGQCADDPAGEQVQEAVAAAERERSEADWRQLLREGQMSGTRTLVRADASEVPVVFAAVVESVAGGRRAVYTLTPSVEAPVLDGELCVASLTNREAQVVRLIAEGLDTSDIAAALHVSPNTVRSHVRNAMSKRSARTRAQLVAQVLGGEGRPPGSG